jgi:hypothetical protein
MALRAFNSKRKEETMINKHFPLPLLVKFIDGEVWELMAPFEYVTKKGEVINVPTKFLSDFASIPRLFWRIIGSPTGRYGPSAIIHDFLYYKKTYTRGKADKIFYEAMGILGVPNWKRSIMHLAVRSFGWIPWKNRKPFIPVAGIVMAFIMAGCASLNVAYDKEGRVKSVKSRGIQDTLVENKDGTKVHRKTAVKLWPENLFTILK